MYRTIALLIGFATPAVMVTGCGSSNPRIPISGTVMYQGEPIAHGMIAFSPKDETKGTREGAVITNGKYAIAAANGLLPGEYVVSIQAPEGPAIKPAPNEPPGSPRRSKERLPEQYNRATTLSIDVTVGGQREFDFNLQ